MMPRFSHQVPRLMIWIAIVGVAPLLLAVWAQRSIPSAAGSLSAITLLCALLVFATMAVEAYLGIYFIVLHQKELRNEVASHATPGIDFSALVTSSKAQEDPMSTVYLSLSIVGLILAPMTFISVGGISPEGLIILSVLTAALIGGGGFGLLRSGILRSKWSFTSGAKKFAQQNGFRSSNKSMHDSGVVNGLVAFFPERNTKTRFEMKGEAYGVRFNLVAFDIYGGKRPGVLDVVMEGALLDDTYGLLIVEARAKIHLESTVDISIIRSAFLNNKTYVLMSGGIPKDRDGMVRIFNLIKEIAG